MAFFIVTFPPNKSKGTESAVFGAAECQYKKDAAEQAAQRFGIDASVYKKGQAREVAIEEYNSFLADNETIEPKPKTDYSLEVLLGGFGEFQTLDDKSRSLMQAYIDGVITESVDSIGFTRTTLIWSMLLEHPQLSTYAKAVSVLFNRITLEKVWREIGDAEASSEQPTIPRQPINPDIPTESPEPPAEAPQVETVVETITLNPSQKLALEHKRAESEFKKQVDELNERVSMLWPGEVLRLEGIPAEVYHATEGLGSTAIKHFIAAPAKYKAYKDGLLDTEKRVFDVGRLAHDMVLLPHEIRRCYIKQHKEIKTRQGGKWVDFQLKHVGKSIVRREDWATAKGCAKSVLAAYPQLFTGGTAEVSYWKCCPDTGVIYKARTDYEFLDRGLAIDLKTARSAEPTKFFYNAMDNGYHIQKALYLWVTGLNDMAFAPVESEPPYLTSKPTPLTEQSDRLGQLLVEKARRELAECMEADEWSGYADLEDEPRLAPKHYKLLQHLELDNA